eukprot:5095694-Amphidinium_carterae.1
MLQHPSNDCKHLSASQMDSVLAKRKKRMQIWKQETLKSMLELKLAAASAQKRINREFSE